VPCGEARRRRDESRSEETSVSVGNPRCYQTARFSAVGPAPQQGRGVSTPCTTPHFPEVAYPPPAPPRDLTTRSEASRWVCGARGKRPTRG